MAFTPALHSFGEEVGWFLTSTAALLGYQLTGYLAEPEKWAALRGVAVTLVALSVLAGLVRAASLPRPAVWLAAGWLAYYAAGRWGAYPYGGTRHALILLPLFVVLMALGVARLWRRHWAAGSALLLALVATMILAPIESQQDLRSVVAYWLANRGDATPTYVYYGAVPGFRYQLQLHDPAAREVPPLWYSDCWADTAAAPDYCRPDNVVYGRWLRELPAADKVAAIRAQLEAPDEPFWLILAHASPAEERELLLVLGQSYAAADTFTAVGASAYLLRASRPG
jgi:hypothetical protein